MKVCGKCGTEKELDEFYNSKKHTSGKESSCKKCRRHRQLALPKLLVTEKKCLECKQTKPSESFHVNQVCRDNLATRCKECERPRGNARTKKHRYGLTVEAYDLMLWAQDSKCAICLKDIGEGNSPHIDHCHSTGEIRGLLCRKCNTGLGMFEDNIDAMQKAREYIARSACRPLLQGSL